MKRIITLLALMTLLISCAPSPEQIERAIEETQIAKEESYTSTPSNTNTPSATDTPAATNTPRPTRTPDSGTFSNPYPLGSYANLVLTTSEGEEVEFKFKVEEVIRGDEAWSVIERANMFNDPPPDGYEVILIKINVKNISSAGFLDIQKYDLAIATKGNVLDSFFTVHAALTMLDM